MTLNQYNLLDQATRSDILLKNGVKLAELRNGNYNLILFQIDAFYVEVWYHLKRSKVIKLVSFTTMEKLTPYLAQMDISGVYNLIKAE